MSESEEATEQIDLRQRTKTFALRILRLYSALPERTDAQVLGRQLLRSGTSVGANYREACRSRSDAEFVSKIGECLRELDETGYWLELLIEADMMAGDRLAPLLEECNQLLAIFTSISKKVKQRNRS